MNTEKSNKKERKFAIFSVVRRLLYKYVDWERLWYTPKCKFERGDAVKLNWKAKIFFNDSEVVEAHDNIMHFDRIDADNVVDTTEDETWNLYWLCAG